MNYSDIIRFWFEELEPKQWFVKDLKFDQLITDRFSDIHTKASRCELYSWRDSPEGRLAEIIILDQFSRNMYRDSPQAFAADPLALGLAQEAIAAGADQALDSPVKRSFLYMPFMHSESLAIHDLSRELFTKNGNELNLEYEEKHRAIIERFGRYPHRNKILGRESTPEELAFLKEPGSSF